MPLIVKDYKWRQAEGTITIQIPLHGIPQTRVDIFTSPQYIKASYEQFFFEAFLLHSINTTESKCIISSTEVIFELKKCEFIKWAKLEIDLTKNEKMELKRKLIDEEHKRFQEECKTKSERKSQLKKVAVREQIGIDTKHREQIEKIKNEEKENALGDLKKWNDQMDEPKIIELPSDNEEEAKIEKSVRLCIPKKPVSRRLKNSEKALIPLPRKMQTLKVNFTPRQFPTPSRESQLAEEEEWLRKQAKLRRSIGFVSEDLRPEEKNPQYLKLKGEEFLKAGNYLGAISAFSFGIKLCKEFPDLYIGRSKAHYNQENYYKASQDCTTALDLLKPAVPSNLNQRVDCITLRSMALSKMGFLKECVDELEVACKLKPTDDNLRKLLSESKEEYELTCKDSK